jgi:hypothetical protein
MRQARFVLTSSSTTPDLRGKGGAEWNWSGSEGKWSAKDVETSNCNFLETHYRHALLDNYLYRTDAVSHYYHCNPPSCSHDYQAVYAIPNFYPSNEARQWAFFSATNRCTDATDMITASLSMIPLVMYSDGSINFYKHKDPIYLVNTDNKWPTPETNVNESRSNVECLFNWREPRG